VEVGMKVKITRSTVAAGKDVYAGQVYEIPDRDAEVLIRMGKAEPVTEEKEKPKGSKK